MLISLISFINLLSLPAPINPIVQSLFQRPLLNAYSPKSGKVPLSKDNYGFYVSADLNNDFSDASDFYPGPDTVQMMLDLHSSQTILVNTSDCFNFSKYCKLYSCIPNITDLLDQSFLDLEVKGYYTQANVYLDYRNWELHIDAILADSCSSSFSTSYGSSRNGIIGLGVRDEARRNYLSSPVFSILLDPDQANGMIFFGNNQSNTVPDAPSITLEADDDWVVNVSGNIQIGNQSIVINNSLIFDLNSNGIGFPIGLYNQVINSLSQAAGISCSNATYQPECVYSGKIQDLPDIFISCGNNTLDIPPRIYVEEDRNSNSSITLHLKAVDSSLSGESYVTPLFCNYIILDARFMSFHYMVFDASMYPPVIILYPPAPPKQDHSWIYILVESVGLVIFITAIVLCYCYFKKPKKNKVRGVLPANFAKIQHDILTKTQCSSNKKPKRNELDNGAGAGALPSEQSFEDQYQLVVEPEIFRRIE